MDYSRPGKLKSWGIHDAVRPLVSGETLARAYAAAEERGSGIPVLEMEESVRMVDQNGTSEHLDRSRLKKVQTPQVFETRIDPEGLSTAL